MFHFGFLPIFIWLSPGGERYHDPPRSPYAARYPEDMGGYQRVRMWRYEDKLFITEYLQDDVFKVETEG